jgi:hypothetical protein
MLAGFPVARNQQQTSDESVAAPTVDRARVDRFNSANKQEETAAA